MAVLDKEHFKEQFRQAAQQGQSLKAPDLRIVAWYANGGVNFDMRTFDCPVPHLLTASQVLMAEAEGLRDSDVYARMPAEQQTYSVPLSEEEVLECTPDDVLLLLERDRGRWKLRSHLCAKPVAEHLAWVAFVLQRLVEAEAATLVAEARQTAERHTVENRA
jgi:hypothetical protein